MKNKIYKSSYSGKNIKEALKYADGDKNLIDDNPYEIISIEFSRNRKTGYVGWTDKPIKEYRVTYQEVEKVEKIKLLKCSRCKIQNKTVKKRLCGYQKEINNEKVWETICDDCEYEHSLDI